MSECEVLIGLPDGGRPITCVVSLTYASLARPSLSALQRAREKPLPGETVWLTSNGLRLKTCVFRSVDSTKRPILVIVLHGDSPFQPPSYQYAFAREAAEQIKNLVVVAILRPGYTDDTGERSQGTRGETTADNYTAQVVDAIAEATRQLKVKFSASRVILAGHSGGAAISGDLIGRVPGLADGALLVSCPCDVPAFRKHMADVQKYPGWLTPVVSLSPLDLVAKVRRSTHVRIVVGTKDAIVPPAIGEEYASALREKGADVKMVQIPGGEHDIFLEPAVFEQLKELSEIWER